MAVELGSGATSVLERVIKELKAQTSGVRWSRPEQLHLTLKFVGDIDTRALPQLCDSVRAACAACPPFSLQLRGVGAFPKHKPPRVLWVGVEEGTEELRGVAWKAIIGPHYPAMALVEVAGLVESAARIEIETTAVVPE